MRRIGVVGTATDIGKTWATTETLIRLHVAGVAASARKPVQSYDPDDDSLTDAEVLGVACDEPSSSVCPKHRWLPAAMAPPMAADVLGLDEIKIADLVAETNWPSQSEIGFVELVGGVRSPVAHDADCVAALRAFDVDSVVLVASAGLGVIDSVRLALDALAPQDVLVFLNHYDASDDLHRRNRDWLRSGDGFDVISDIGHLAHRLHPAEE